MFQTKKLRNSKASKSERSFYLSKFNYQDRMDQEAIKLTDSAYDKEEYFKVFYYS
jgi:hypothetical protein